MKHTSYNNHYTLCFLFLSICFLAVSCARIVTPKGGDKDSLPPKYRTSSPKMNATNFKGKSIAIDFDEYIVLDNATDKLIVSPPLKKKPVIGSKLKTLYIKDLDSLQENTTYIFDFGDAITDFTEGNRLNHFSFAFSTGAVIDTLSYKGRLLNAYTLKAEKAKYVALYRNKDKDFIRSHIPDYITKCDSNGRFFFQNIKGGDYLLLAFDDLNRNMIYDLPTEGFGVKDNISIMPDITKTTDSISDTIDSIEIKTTTDTILFNKAQDTIIQINSSKLISNRELQITTSTAVNRNFDIQFTKPLLDTSDYKIFFNKTSDTITVVTVGDSVFDTLKAKISISDIKENIDLVYHGKSDKRKNKKSTFKLNLQNKDIAHFSSLSLLVPNVVNTDKFSQINATAYNSTDTIAIVFHADSNNIKCFSAPADQLSQNATYTLSVDSSQIFDCNGNYNDTLRCEIHIDSQDDYGSFAINIQDTTTDTQSLILSLFGSDKQIGEDIFAKTNSGYQTFFNLKEGKYKLRIIIDANNNRRWDAGDFDSGTLSEKVMFFYKDISIRKGWQTQEEWDISYK